MDDETIMTLTGPAAEAFVRALLDPDPSPPNEAMKRAIARHAEIVAPDRTTESQADASKVQP